MTNVPLLAARRDLTARRPVYVLTDLSSRLEEEYCTPQKMSSRSSLDFLAAGHQDDWSAEQAWARAMATTTRRRCRLPADEHRRTVEDEPGPAALVALTAHDAALRRPSPAGTAPRIPRHRRGSCRSRRDGHAPARETGDDHHTRPWTAGP